MNQWIPPNNYSDVIMDQKTQILGSEFRLMVTCTPYFVSDPKHTIINWWIPLNNYLIVFPRPKHLCILIQKTEYVHACLSLSDALIVFLRKEQADLDLQTMVNL